MTTTGPASDAHPGRSHRFLPAVAAAGAIVGAMILTAPAAYALSENQIKEDCRAQGGSYSTYGAANGNRVTQCCVKDRFNPRAYFCEYYVNDQFDGTQELNEPPPPPASVGLPPGAVAPGNPPVAVNPPGGNPAPTTTPR